MLHLNTDLCALVLQKDLEYWQIDELILGMMLKYKTIGLQNVIYIFILLKNGRSTFLLHCRAVLCPKILSRDRNLRQRTKRRTRSEEKRGTKTRG